MNVVEVGGLRVGLGAAGREILRGVDLEVASGEIVGLAGETGSGKSTLGLSTLGYLAPGLTARAGRIALGGVPIVDDGVTVPEAALRPRRGREISSVPQDPGGALNPGMTIGRSFAEVMRAHGAGGPAEWAARRSELFEAVGLPGDADFAERYPHELSGGQQQRVAIAIAFALDPSVVVMDEPTTGLDVATKEAVARLIVSLVRERGSGVVLISHDLPLLIRVTDRIVVMRDGVVVEQGPARQIAEAPQHPYTQRLIDALPVLGAPPAGGGGEPLLTVTGLSARHGRVQITHGVDLEVAAGDCVAIVGESGSGKTTTARSIAGLHAGFDGEVRLAGELLARDVARRTRAQRRAMQYVFQNPWGALNPRRAIGATVALSARKLLGVSRAEAHDLALDALARVGLGHEFFGALPHRLSGGQRQRVAIARALVADPDVLVCDEVTSSLDLSVQAEIMKLIAGLKRERGLAVLFITHDLALAGEIADHMVVLQNGCVVESGPTGRLLSAPAHEYTASLVRAARLGGSAP